MPERKKGSHSWFNVVKTWDEEREKFNFYETYENDFENKKTYNWYK